MDIAVLTPIQVLRISVTYMMLAFSMSIGGAVLSQKNWTFRFYFKSLFYHVFLVIGSFVFDFSTMWMPILSFVIIAFFLFFTCKLKGLQWLKAVFLINAFFVISDMLCGIIIMRFFAFSENELYLAKKALSPLIYLTNGLASLINLFFVLCYYIITHVKWNRLNGEYFFRIIRPVLIVLCILVLFIRTMQRTTDLTYIDRFRVVLPDFIVIILLLTIGGSYVIQDIKFLKQSRLNSTLIYQKEAQDALLKDTRTFRHNIANLLYGFQGTLLSHDQKAIEEYYAKLVNTCAIINNENVVSLQRIPSLAVSTLLLNKIQQANGESIPFYLFVDEKIVYRAMKDKEMCEILGIILDNALEAAKEASAPLITMEFHNAEDDMEIVVRNTFNELTLPSKRDDIFFPLGSTKEGHAGLGLSLIQEMIHNNKNAVFNIFIRGRFVEASLLIRN